jgi:two-component system osmolarity sensor histidine kinase EnvZ
MEKMVNSYLNFLRGGEDERTEIVSLYNAVEKIADVTRLNAIPVHNDIDRDIKINVRPMAFGRCIQNLVSNAEKYAKEVWISAKEKEESIVIIIDDNGIGLTPDLFEEVFKPFYRADQSRNTSTGGVGLGLPIVRDIIHAHGGEVHLEKSPRGGLRAVVTLPK